MGIEHTSDTTIMEQVASVIGETPDSDFCDIGYDSDGPTSFPDSSSAAYDNMDGFEEFGG